MNPCLLSTPASKPEAKAFIDFLLSPEGASIFRRWGWKA